MDIRRSSREIRVDVLRESLGWCEISVAFLVTMSVVLQIRVGAPVADQSGAAGPGRQRAAGRSGRVGETVPHPPRCLHVRILRVSTRDLQKLRQSRVARGPQGQCEYCAGAADPK